MNKRVILYGAVGLMLVMALGGGGGDSSTSARFFPLSLRQHSALKNECMKGIDSFEGAILAKIKFCECVVAEFDTVINAHKELHTKHTAFIEAYMQLAASPREASRSLASHRADPSLLWESGTLLTILHSERRFEYPFRNLQPQINVLSVDVDADWKKSMWTCTQAAPVAGRVQ